MSLPHTTPETLAEAILREYGRSVTYAPIPVDGARRAARHIQAALERRVT